MALVIFVGVALGVGTFCSNPFGDVQFFVVFVFVLVLDVCSYSRAFKRRAGWPDLFCDLVWAF